MRRKGKFMWLIDFWNSLVIGQQVFFCAAVPATLMLVIMIITMLVGMGGGDADLDGDVDADGLDVDAADAGISLFSSRGIVAMLAILGWSGFVLLDPSVGLHWAIGIAISLAFGFLTLFLVALAMRGISKLQSSGNLDISRAIGKVAQVYLTIPANGASAGKVNITIQERLAEISAITTADKPLVTGSYVRVVSVSEGGVLVVEPLENK